MKGKVGLTATLVLLLPTAIHAQQPQDDSDAIEITAQILDDLTVTGAEDLDFGVLGTDETVTIGPTDGDAGRFDITGTANQNVEITSNDDDGITLDDGNGATISFTDPQIAGSDDSDDPTDGAALNWGATPELGADGGYHVFLGGTLETGTESGTFTGDFTITVAYPDI